MPVETTVVPMPESMQEFLVEIALKVLSQKEGGGYEIKGIAAWKIIEVITEEDPAASTELFQKLVDAVEDVNALAAEAAGGGAPLPMP